MRKRRREPKHYATLPGQYTTQALQSMRFVRVGSSYVRRGPCRSVLAEATSTDGIWWRIKPYVRRWR